MVHYYSPLQENQDKRNLAVCGIQKETTGMFANGIAADVPKI